MTPMKEAIDELKDFQRQQNEEIDKSFQDVKDAFVSLLVVNFDMLEAGAERFAERLMEPSNGIIVATYISSAQKQFVFNATRDLKLDIHNEIIEMFGGKG